MEMNEDLAHQIRLYLQGKLNENERKALFAIIAEEGSIDWNTVMEQVRPDWMERKELDETRKNNMLQELLLAGKLYYDKPDETGNRVPVMPRWALAAASVVLLATLIIYLLPAGRKNTIPPVLTTRSGDVAPGHDGAILTLADGTTLILDSMTNGIIADQAGSRLTLDKGRVVYDAKEAIAVSYNKMTTPRGRRFQLILPDGSKVWLNAASSISYPTAFAESERMVTITGEVYFEVAKNAKRPFKVKVNDSTSIEVLGTSFNINAYGNEPAIHVTLLEGAVAVNANTSEALLKPGQQASITSTVKVFNDVDTEEVMAWKNGKFVFSEKTGIESIMRQIARWYDVEIEYKGTVRDRFGGSIASTVDLTRILKMLEATGAVKFRIEGKKIIVMPGK